MALYLSALEGGHTSIFISAPHSRSASVRDCGPCGTVVLLLTPEDAIAYLSFYRLSDARDREAKASRRMSHRAVPGSTGCLNSTSCPMASDLLLGCVLPIITTGRFSQKPTQKDAEYYSAVWLHLQHAELCLAVYVCLGYDSMLYARFPPIHT